MTGLNRWVPVQVTVKNLKQGDRLVGPRGYEVTHVSRESGGIYNVTTQGPEGHIVFDGPSMATWDVLRPVPLKDLQCIECGRENTVKYPLRHLCGACYQKRRRSMTGSSPETDDYFEAVQQALGSDYARDLADDEVYQAAVRRAKRRV